MGSGRLVLNKKRPSLSKPGGAVCNPEPLIGRADGKPVPLVGREVGGDALHCSHTQLHPQDMVKETG
jgi:hypothetical protein